MKAILFDSAGEPEQALILPARESSLWRPGPRRRSCDKRHADLLQPNLERLRHRSLARAVGTDAESGHVGPALFHGAQRNASASDCFVHTLDEFGDALKTDAGRGRNGKVIQVSQ